MLRASEGGGVVEMVDEQIWPQGHSFLMFFGTRWQSLGIVRLFQVYDRIPKFIPVINSTINWLIILDHNHEFFHLY